MIVDYVMLKKIGKNEYLKPKEDGREFLQFTKNRNNALKIFNDWEMTGRGDMLIGENCPTEPLVDQHMDLKYPWVKDWSDFLETIVVYKVPETANASLEELLKHSNREPVYFLYSALTNRIKIGKSWTPSRRRGELSTGAGADLVCLAVTTRNTEEELHSSFGDERKHGEWFEPSPRLCGYIASVQGVE